MARPWPGARVDRFVTDQRLNELPSTDADSMHARPCANRPRAERPGESAAGVERPQEDRRRGTPLTHPASPSRDAQLPPVRAAVRPGARGPRAERSRGERQPARAAGGQPTPGMVMPTVDADRMDCGGPHTAHPPPRRGPGPARPRAGLPAAPRAASSASGSPLRVIPIDMIHRTMM